MSIEEILSQTKILIQLSAHTRRSKAASDPIPLPVTLNPPPEPAGVVGEAVLQERPTRFRVAGAFKGDQVQHDHQASKQGNDSKHGDEVEDEQPGDSPKPSDNAGERCYEDEDSGDYERPLQNLDAEVVWLG